MSSEGRAFRRYEILLPLRFNEGEPVPPELMADTLLELRSQFGAVSAETQIIQGSWYSSGEAYQDDLVRLFIDVEDSAANRRYFADLKEKLKARFHQLEIWITTHPIEVL